VSSSEYIYKTIQEPASGIFRDKGSKFIGYAFPFENESILKNILTDIKGEHPKARHFCWAYRLSPDREVYRLSDDGEPSGTAGRPILNSLLSSDLTNILVVVVRYFGGTLLGVPGLINAYKSACLEALLGATVLECTVNDIYSVTFDYIQMNDIMRIIKENNINIIGQSFDTTCLLDLEISKLQLDIVLERLNKISGIELNYKRTI